MIPFPLLLAVGFLSLDTTQRKRINFGMDSYFKTNLFLTGFTGFIRILFNYFRFPEETENTQSAFSGINKKISIK
jgi:hypothetical protein